MNPRKKAWLVILGIVSVEITPLVIFNHSLRGFLRALGLVPNSNHGSVSAWMIAVFTLVTYTTWSVRRIPYLKAHFFDVDALKVFTILLFAPVAGVFEEVYFRRVLMDQLAIHHWGIISQIAFSALAFGLAHGMWALFGGQWRVGRNASVATGVLGALLAVAYVLGGRSLAPPVLAHTLINVCIEPWLVLAAVSRSWSSKSDAVVPAYTEGVLPEAHTS